MPTLAAGSPSPVPCRVSRLHRGFTLLELLVVLAIVAFVSTAVGFALRDTVQTRLEREGYLVPSQARSQLAEHVDWKVWLSLHDVDVSSRANPVHQPFSSNDYNTVIQLAMADQGVALGWHHLVGDLVAKGTLVRPIPDEIVHKDRCHYLTVREDRAEGDACKRFRDWIVGEL